MDGFLPYFTGDGSVGLYSTEFDDIYHSAFGALSEAYDKFILPLDLKKDIRTNIKVLDVCYGLGYNSKTFLNHIGVNKNISFDCLDINKNLILFSPFIKTNINFIDFVIRKINSHYGQNNLSEIHKKKIAKFVNTKSNVSYKISDDVNRILIENLYTQFGDSYFDKINIAKKKFRPFFEPRMIKLGEFYQKTRLNSIRTSHKGGFLHNIYYRYVSERYNFNKNEHIKFNFYIGDARNTVKNLRGRYDYILLDAFTTDKCPQLWSLDFIHELYKLTADDGVLITYSTSALVRNTMFESGYFVGKILNRENKPIGTICSKNKNKIKHELNEYEYGLTKTKAGIPYNDKNLCCTSEAILRNRRDEVNKSKLLSSSKYVKQYKGAKNEL